MPLDDSDTFTSPDEERAAMEVASFRYFVDDIFAGHVWFKGIQELGKHEFVKYQLTKYAQDLDRALNFLVWNA